MKKTRKTKAKKSAKRPAKKVRVKKAGRSANASRRKSKKRVSASKPRRSALRAGVRSLAPRLAAGRSIDDLDLVDYAKEAAQALQTAHPSVVFTSGRRNVKEQADAMAGNIVQNRKWIEQTYVQSAERDALQKWVDNNPGATTKATISAGLEGIMNGWTDAQKGNLSRHFSGQAFDVQPVAGQPGDAIKTTIRGLANLRKFLESEGGLTIWHADFEK